MLKKISISPESPNHGDNEKNVAYLYRGYYIWKVGAPGEGSLFDAWNFAPAAYHVPDAALGEAFEPYWDDDGCSKSRETRRECLAAIYRLFEQGLARPAPEAPQPDPDARRSATAAVEEGLHFLQDAAEKFAAAGKPLFAAECYALVERLAAQTEVVR